MQTNEILTRLRSDIDALEGMKKYGSIPKADVLALVDAAIEEATTPTTSIEPVPTTDGSIEFSTEPAASNGPVPATLADMSIAKATPFIEAMEDLETLMRWHEADTRAGVHKLIDARIETLTAPPAEPQ